MSQSENPPAPAYEAADVGLAPTVRARAADALAHAVRTGSVQTDRLRSLVREARLSVDAQYAQISLLSDRQISILFDHDAVESGGVEAPEIPATLAFEDTICVIALRTDDALQIDELATDERTASLPAVEQGIVSSYLGMPLRQAPHGMIGVLCAYNGEWTQARTRRFERFAIQVGAELETVRDSLVQSA